MPIKNKKSALHVAAQNGHVNVVKVLIQNGVDVNAVDNKSTASLLAAEDRAGFRGTCCCQCKVLMDGTSTVQVST